MGGSKAASSLLSRLKGHPFVRGRVEHSAASASASVSASSAAAAAANSRSPDVWEAISPGTAVEERQGEANTPASSFPSQAAVAHCGWRATGVPGQFMDPPLCSVEEREQRDAALRRGRRNLNDSDEKVIRAANDKMFRAALLDGALGFCSLGSCSAYVSPPVPSPATIYSARCVPGYTAGAQASYYSATNASRRAADLAGQSGFRATNSGYTNGAPGRWYSTSEGGAGDQDTKAEGDIVEAPSEPSEPSDSSDSSALSGPVIPEGPKERLRKREKYGTYEDDIEEEIHEGAWEIEDAEGKPYFTNLYDARQKVDEWISDPTFWGMLAAPPEEGEVGDPVGEYKAQRFKEDQGPELRWETRLILGPGGEAWHPANRKVKVSVYVRELSLTPLAKERLVALVGRRYNSKKDELTIISERYEQREENRKDVLRTLKAVIEEAKKADELAAEEAPAAAAGGSF